MQISILQSEQLSSNLEEEVRKLFCELNSELSQLPLAEVLATEKQIVFAIAKENDELAGMASMALYKVISGYKGMIEDVVVSKKHRGKGIGRKLMEKLVEEAASYNLTEILLFSGHHREAAIKLYKSLGFILKNSGLYQLKLS